MGLFSSKPPAKPKHGPVSLDKQAQAIGYVNYSEYLSSPWWKQRRTSWRGARKCYVCGSKTALHYHHITYERMGKELNKDIVLLCHAHHEATHRLARRHNASLRNAHVRAREDYRGTRPKNPKEKKARAEAVRRWEEERQHLGLTKKQMIARTKRQHQARQHALGL